MMQRRQDLRLALESGAALGIGRELRGQNLDGNVPLQPRLSRAIDLTHAAGANGGHDLVRADASPRSQHHRQVGRL